jgi:hypothetical protein
MLQPIRLRTLDPTVLTENEAWWRIYHGSFPDAEHEGTIGPLFVV